MSVILSKHAGFCPGVKKADKAVRMLIPTARLGNRVYTLGSLIHNSLYNEELRKIKYN